MVHFAGSEGREVLEKPLNFSPDSTGSRIPS